MSAAAAALVALGEDAAVHTPATRAPLSVGELSRVLGITPASMSHVCGRLEQAGLLARACDVADHRRTLLALTLAGDRAARCLQDRHAQALAAALPLPWGSEDLRHALEAVRDHLRRATATRGAGCPPSQDP
jgi:DNA-binding MarR family transcriptional regulator